MEKHSSQKKKIGKKISFLPSLLRLLQSKSQKIGMPMPALIRNFRGLPFELFSNDIDLIVATKHRKKATQTIHDACIELNLDCIKYDSMYYTDKFLIKLGNENLELDLNFSFFWYFVEFYNVFDLYRSQEVHDGFIILGTYEERTFITFCHSFLYGGFINTKYINDIRACSTLPYFKFCMQKIFGRHAKYLLQLIDSGKPVIPRIHANLIRVVVLLRFATKKILPFRQSKSAI